MHKLTSLLYLAKLVLAVFLINSSFVQAQTIGSVSLSSPSSGSTFSPGTSTIFSWSTASGANAYDIEFDTGQSYQSTTSSSQPTLNWLHTAASVGNHTWRVRGKNGSRVGSWSSTRSYTVANPSITLNTPNGGQSWAIGSSQNITWSSVGLTGNIKIEINGNYSSGSWETLFSSIPNDGSETWMVSGTQGTAKRIRISSASNASINDVSASNFTMTSPSINLNAPNGGQSWAIGSSQNITWSSAGLSGNVKIEINGNYPSGAWETIYSSIPNDGSEAWTVSGTAGTAKRIRISSVSNSSINDISASNFTITTPSISLNVPNGGESWTIGSNQNINWSSSGLSGNVKIEVNGSYPSGAWETIYASIPNDGSETWTVSGTAGAAKRIRISSVSNTAINDVSAGNFTMNSPSISVNTPNGGESWTIGSTQNISWSSSGLSGNVKVEINGNYPSGTWETIFSSIPNDGSESWTVSGTAGTAKRIRVSSASNSSISDISASNFTLISPSINIIAPNGGESWAIGSTQNINWSAPNISGNIKLEINGNYPNGTWEILFASIPNDGSEPWMVTGSEGTAKRIRISSVNNSSINDISATNFTLTSPSINLLTPNGGENWAIGSVQNISWSAPNLTGNIKIEINGNYPSGQWETLFASIPNDGSESWTVSGTAGTSKRIRLSSVSNNAITDISSNNFALTSPSINVNAPNGGESWMIGSVQHITWAAPGLAGNIKVEINGNYPTGQWETLFSSIPNDGSEPWTVSGTAGAAKRIRITSVNTPTITAFSDNNFTIVGPNFSIISPNGGENWTIGSNQNITWSAAGVAGNVKVEINGNYPTGQWEILYSSIANDGTEPWIVSGTAGNAKRIRITSVNSPAISDLSANNFTLSNPVINLTSPNGGENWAIGSPKNITWNAPGLTGSLKIEINGNYPTGQWEVINANTANDGTEPWVVSGMVGTAKRIRISSLSNPSITMISYGNFTMSGVTFAMISPNGGENWKIGSTETLKWEPAGIAGNVRIEANGTYPLGEWRTIIPSTPNDGSEPWFIEGVEGNAKRIRITSLNTPTVSDLSDSNFTLTNPIINLYSPNGGENWAIGATKSITWNAPGLIGNVKIEINGNYPTGQWEIINANTPNDGAEPWVVSGMSGTAKRIRITSVENSNITILSYSNFTMTGLTFSLITPNGGETWKIGSTETIKWEPGGITGNVRIEANGAYPSGEWRTIIDNTPNDGTEPWHIEGVAGNAKRIRIIPILSPTAVIVSQNNFSLNSTAAMISPNGGEQLRINANHTIKWALPGVSGNVKIEANGDYPNGQWLPIISNTANDGIENWLSEGVQGSAKRIRITSLNDPSISVISQSNFAMSNEITWSGRKWKVKSLMPYLQENPGNNYWSSSQENARVDDEGNLHLKLVKVGNQWYCTQIESNETNFGYGEYTFQLASRVDQLEKNVIYGLFTYKGLTNFDRQENEIDIEFARWNDTGGYNDYLNSHYVFQYRLPGNVDNPNLIEAQKFNMGGEVFTTHKFIWVKDNLLFQSYTGNAERFSSTNRMISNKFYSNEKLVPFPFAEQVLLNLYLTKDNHNFSTNAVNEVIIKSFSFNSEANFQFQISNIPNGPAFTPGANGKILLYDLNYKYQNKSYPTSALGTATVQNLNFGNNYIFETYHTPSNPTTIFGEEFWGVYSNKLLMDPSAKVELKRHMPFSEGYRVFNQQTNQEVTGQSVTLGTPLRIEITTKNSDSNSRAVKVRMVLDQDKSAAYDFDETGIVKLIQSGSESAPSSIVTTFIYTPTSPGDYFGAAGTLVNTTGINFTISDGWAWESKKWITVEPSGNQTIFKPSLITISPTAITKSTVSSGGEIKNDGGSSITSRGLCWHTSPNPTIDDVKNINGAGNGSFTNTISGLVPGTKYFMRAYATNSAGTAYGNEISFTCLPNPTSPLVNTTSANNIAQDKASSGGVIVSDGGSTITAMGICWSVLPNPTIADTKTNDGSGLATFNSTLKGLNPGVQYYIRAYATNAYGTSYGNNSSFRTLSISAVMPPSISTEQVSAISASTATSGGIIVSEGGAPIAAKGIVWGIAPNPTLDYQKTNTGTGSENFTSSIAGLNLGTTYHIRAYATNAAGTAYGENKTFTTNSPFLLTPPLISTIAAYAISANSLQSGGNILSDGGSSILEKGICWSTSPQPTTSDQKIAQGVGLTSFSSSITGLSPGTNYHLRAYAINALGISYGDNINLTTPASEEPFSLPVTNFRIYGINESCITSNDGKISITAEKQLNYTATIKVNGQETNYPFISSLEISKLIAASYEICITVSGEPGYRQCYNLIISEPKSLTVFSSIRTAENLVDIELSGANNYFIDINGKRYTTTASKISLPISKGNNVLAVHTDIPCQGTKTTTLTHSVIAYPVPFQRILNVNVYAPKTQVEVHSLEGKLLFSKYYQDSGTKELSLDALSTGLYILTLKTLEYKSHFKISKQ